MIQEIDARDARDATLHVLFNGDRHESREEITKIKFANYIIISAAPATGILYIINNFLSGHVRMRGLVMELIRITISK